MRLKYGKIRQPGTGPSSRREQDYQKVQAFLESGDRLLWEELYADAYQTAYRCAENADFRQLLGEADYREITDEAFAKCCEQLDRYRGWSRFSTWVGGYSKNITRNRCRKVLTGLRYRRELYEASTGRMIGWDPLWVLLRLERDSCLWEALGDISEESRQMLEAIALEKLPPRTAARELGMTQKELKERLEAACNVVRRRFLRYYSGEWKI